MAMNRVQFQAWFSLSVFLKRYGTNTEAQRERALESRPRSLLAASRRALFAPPTVLLWSCRWAGEGRGVF